MIVAEKLEFTEYLKKGIEAREKKEYEPAIKFLNIAAEHNPDDALPYLAIGLVYKDQKKPEDAIGAFEKAIEIDPKRADAYKVLGLSYRELGRVEKAEKAFQNALEFEVFTDNRIQILSILGAIFLLFGVFLASGYKDRAFSKD